MQLLSNELKAVAVMTDISESDSNITRDYCMSVEHFDYHCERKRDRDGRTYGASDPVMLCFDLRLNAADQAQPFYRQMKDDDSGIISFLFNATFSDTKRLSGYDEAMAVEGFIVDIREDFRSAALEQTEEQIILRARMQVRSIVYIGQNENKQLCFIQ